MSYFPMCVDLAGRDCLVVGGGRIAAGKVHTLCSFGAKVTVIARDFPHGTAEFAAAHAPGHVVTRQRAFEESDLTGMSAVVAATDDGALNERIYHLCCFRQIPVNVVDRKDLCTFMFPSVVKHDDLVISVSTGGNSPALAAYLRRKLEEYVPAVYGDINRRMGEARTYIHEELTVAADRKAAFQELLDLMLGERTLKIGTRTSDLALAQTDLFLQCLHVKFPDIRCEILPMKTLGDRLKDRPMKEMGGKGVFVEALEDALRDGTIDCAVHSAKDMSSSLPEDMRIACVLPREDPSDVLVMKKRRDGAEMEPERREDSSDGAVDVTGAQTVCGSGVVPVLPSMVIGTGSPRREAQLKRRFPGCRVKNIRGNLPTRLKKLRDGEYDAIVLAAAGLVRAGLDREDDLQYYPLPTEEMVPAGGQGTIAVESRSDRLAFLGILTDPDAALALETERRVLRRIAADCHDAVGVYARRETDGRLRVDLWKARPSGTAPGNRNDAPDAPPEAASAAGDPETAADENAAIYHVCRTEPAAEAAQLADEMAEELIKWEEYPSSARVRGIRV